MPSASQEYDVIVCGGGPAGLSAAVTAARRGAATLIVERFNCFGGTATNGLNYGFESSIGMNNAMHDELFDRMKRLKGVNGVYFDIEACKFASQTMLEESGSGILLHSFVESAIAEDGVVKGVAVVNKGGRQELFAKTVIDATGDADVVASAGGQFEKGDRKDGRLQALTLRPRIGGVEDVEGVDWQEVNERLQAEIRKGAVKTPSYIRLDTGGVCTRGEHTYNQDMATGVDATDPWALSKAETEARKRVWELLDFSRRNVPGWSKAYLIDTAAHIGVRETRRIAGRYSLTMADALSCRKFDDGIARCSRWSDLHDKEVFLAFDKHIAATSLPPGDWYEIPYRCLIPKRVEGLLAAGRCISSDREANGSLRIMAVCMGLGLAAGVAASLAAGRGVSPSELDGAEVRKEAKMAGADI